MGEGAGGREREREGVGEGGEGVRGMHGQGGQVQRHCARYRSAADRFRAAAGRRAGPKQQVSGAAAQRRQSRLWAVGQDGRRAVGQVGRQAPSTHGDGGGDEAASAQRRAHQQHEILLCGAHMTGTKAEQQFLWSTLVTSCTQAFPPTAASAPHIHHRQTPRGAEPFPNYINANPHSCHQPHRPLSLS